MSPTFSKDFLIKQGATFEWSMLWGTGKDPFVPHDLTGCSGRMQVRKTVEAEEVLLDSTEQIVITFTPTPGEITIAINADDTAAIEWLDGVYDMEVVFPDTTVVRLLQGKVQVSPEVTR